MRRRFHPAFVTRLIYFYLMSGFHDCVLELLLTGRARLISTDKTYVNGYQAMPNQCETFNFFRKILPDFVAVNPWNYVENSSLTLFAQRTEYRALV